MRVIIAGAVVSVCALGVAGAQAQNFSSSADAPRVTSAAGTQANAARPSAAEIVARMLDKNQERLAALQHYESERTYKVEYTGTGGEHHAAIQVHAVYTGPNQKQLTVVSESGSKFICDKVLRKAVESEQEASAQSNRMQMTLGPENYSAELVGEETIATPSGPVATWVLQVTPKVDN